MFADALGCIWRYPIFTNQAHDTWGLELLLEGHEFGALIGNRAFDADRLPEWLEGHGRGGGSLEEDPQGFPGMRQGDVQVAAPDRQFAFVAPNYAGR